LKELRQRAARSIMLIAEGGEAGGFEHRER
jgi:hypothetical protein